VYYLTENAFHPMMFGIVVTFACGSLWFILRKRLLLIIALIALFCTIAVVVTEQAIVTDSEQLVIEVNRIANAISDNDMAEVLSCINPANSQIVSEVKGQMPRIDFKSVSVFGLTPPQVNSDTEPPTAKVSFTSRISADGSSSRFGVSGTGVVRVNLDYIKTPAGQWQINSYNYDRVRPNDFMGGG
jgi:hypothetical protein